MRPICLSISSTLKHREVYNLYDKVLGENPRCVFLVDRTNPVLEELLKKHRSRRVRYHLNKAAISNLRMAYEDRAKRMVEMAQACYCLVDSKDKYAGPVEVALEFMKRHPGLPVKIFWVNGKNWNEVGMEEARKMVPWDMFRYK